MDTNTSEAYNMVSLPKNNAFGAGSPSWNLPFPAGNITAAEILAYLPHWLKTIDVIDRFITNGARSASIAAIVNEFRHQPTEARFQPNSAQIMMSYAMRRAGYKEWTVGTHTEWPRQSELREDDLNVKGFRPPHLTHPKYVHSRRPQDLARNQAVEPIDFKDLALHIKKHPSGADALDLTRCVQYALQHRCEKWLFPVDFQRLVIHLGGPALVTHSHHDRQVFARYDNYSYLPAKSAPGKPNGTLNSKVMPRRKNMRQTRIGSALSSALSRSRSATPAITPQKRTSEGLGRVVLGSKRRSGRLVGKAINLKEESDADATDKDYFNSPYSGYSTPAKKRKLSRIPTTPESPSNDSDFIGYESEADDDVPEAEVASDEEFVSPTPAPRGRAAARKARQVIQASFVSTRTPLVLKVPKVPSSPEKVMPKSIPSYMSTEISPEVMKAAKLFAQRPPMWLAPPILSANRLKVDSSSIYLYAAEGCTTMAEMWASALSSSRFRGPRRHPPFRELHRLTDPDPRDGSDWAENIRWAKEQHKVFGSETWTEYDYHLECITDHRLEMMWVSEEVIQAGM